MSVLGRARIAALGAALSVSATAVPAATPERDLRQMHHKAWSLADGAPPDVWALAQSHDGYLWLGTGAGLYRFDGVRFEQFIPVSGEALPSSNINSLLVDHEGALWIGFVTGAVSKLLHGHLTNYALGLPHVPVLGFTQAHDGSIWVATGDRRLGGLARYSDGKWTIVGAGYGLPPGSVSSVLASRDGTLWVVVGDSLAKLAPGSRYFTVAEHAAPDSPRLAQSADGSIWLSVALGTGLHRVPGVGGKAGLRLTPPATELSRAETIMFDHRGALWGTYGTGGVFQIRDVPAATATGTIAAGEKFGLADGLTSDLANPILEDREGNVWVGTNLGLDQFRGTNAVEAAGLPVTSRQGFRIVRGEDSSVYVTGSGFLFQARAGLPAVKLTSLPRSPAYLHAAGHGTIWMGSREGLIERLHGAFRRVDVPAGKGQLWGWADDRHGRACVFSSPATVLCHDGTKWSSRAIPVDATRDPPTQITFGPADGIWLNYGSQLGLSAAGRLRIFGAREGLDIGNIETVAVGTRQVFAGGDFGIARFDGRRFTTLRSERHPMLSRVSGIVQTSNGDLWLNGIKGAVKISRSDLDRAFAHPRQALAGRLFNLDDGMPGVAQQDSESPTVIEAGDGRLWFVTSHGIAWIDPRNLVHNPLPPSVVIKALVAGGATFDPRNPIGLPAGTSNLQIAYTALSLAIPDRVRFRYKLEGVDTDWVDPGPRREAFYTGLTPGHYRFRVIAANNDGVWNTTGALLTFDIPPTFLQSAWFKAIVAALVALSLWLLYLMRMRQISARLRARLEERMGERERIARELHDTLLQSFQGLLFRFQAIMEELPASLGLRATMEDALDSADEALADGRNRVANLRTATVDDDLSHMLADAAAKMATGFTGQFRVVTEGRPRRLHPIVLEELARIGEQAIGNSLQHSEADSIEISIVYHSRELRVEFRDDGVGIAEEILATGGRHRHFGLIGMRERAEKIRAEFVIASGSGAGTEVTLRVPAAIAYARRVQRTRWRDRFRRLSEA